MSTLTSLYMQSASGTVDGRQEFKTRESLTSKVKSIRIFYNKAAWNQHLALDRIGFILINHHN